MECVYLEIEKRINKIISLYELCFIICYLVFLTFSFLLFNRYLLFLKWYISYLFSWILNIAVNFLGFWWSVFRFFFAFCLINLLHILFFSFALLIWRYKFIFIVFYRLIINLRCAALYTYIPILQLTDFRQ
jgi:hypothetical protein